MIIGTAGHIDHGKTSLVKALTGVDADRLKEEKERGITLDLGFAYAPLPGGEVLGFVDVPGHEKLIHNMLAGATGIDFVLLVIAADDGPMPQTREHAAILDLLGLHRGAVALTKIDRVPAERVAAVRREIASLLSGAGLADSPVFPLSAVSGEGVPALQRHLEQAAENLPARTVFGHFRLAVDRSFTLDGIGTIVTGTVFSGEVRVGDRLLISPSGDEVRVRGIHAQNIASYIGRAGQRCALNLTGAQLEKGDIRRGDWLVEAPAHLPVLRFDARCRVLDTEPKALRHWTPVHLHAGTCDVTARVALLESDAIEPGREALVQIIADRPVCLLHGDRYILRDQSATRTLGGGHVVDPVPPARDRRTPVRLAALHAMEEPDPGVAVLRALENSPYGVDLIRFSQARNIRQDDADALWRRLPMHLAATTGFAPARWEALKQFTLERLAAEHQQVPDALGPDRARLHRMALPALAQPVFLALLDELLAADQIAQSGPWLHLPEHRVTLTAAEENVWQRILPMLQFAPFQPPRVRDIALDLPGAETIVRNILHRVACMGAVYRVAHDHYFTQEAVRSLSLVARKLAETHGSVRAAEFRDQIGTGRKLAIQILEFFDRIGYTRRTGDEHRLRQENLIF